MTRAPGSVDLSTFTSRSPICTRVPQRLASRCALAVIAPQHRPTGVLRMPKRPYGPGKSLNSQVKRESDAVE